MTKIPLYIAAAGLVLLTVKWAFLHDRRLPRHRVRYLRLRLRLRLHRIRATPRWLSCGGGGADWPSCATPPVRVRR